MSKVARHWTWALAFGLWLVMGVTAAQAEGLWEVYLQARAHDPQIKAAQAALEAARQAHPKAMAALLPTVWASGSSGLNRFDDKNPTIDPKTGQPTTAPHYDSLKYGLYLSQPLVNLQIWAGVPQASRREREAEAIFQANQAELIVRLLERYLKVLGTQERLHWVRAEKLSIAHGLERARRARELGVLSILAEQRAQAALDLAEADEVAAEHQVANSLEGLSEITGHAHSRLARLLGEVVLTSPTPNDLAHWQGLARQGNLSVVAKGYAHEAADLEVWRQGAGHLPTLNLSGSHYYENSGGGRIPGEDIMSTVMLEVKVPLFEGGATRAQTKEARAQRDKAGREEESQRRLSVKQAGEAFRGVNEGLRRLKALAQAQRSAAAAVESALREMEVGSGTMVEFLEALRDLYRVRRDTTDARHEVVLNRTRLLQAAGMLDDQEVLALNAQFEEGDLPLLLVSLPGLKPTSPPAR